MQPIFTNEGYSSSLQQLSPLGPSPIRRHPHTAVLITTDSDLEANEASFSEQTTVLYCEDSDQQIPLSPADNDPAKYKIYRRPLFTVFMAASIGIMFMVDDPAKEIWHLTEPLSPPIDSMVFRTVENWPQCGDVRAQAWRLVSNHLLHVGWLHVGGNAIALGGFGILLESLLFTGRWAVVLIFETSVVVGTLGHSFTFPYDGLVGCSMGVYGLTGACWPMLLHERNHIHPWVFRLAITVLIIQIVTDICSYIILYDPGIAYVAHFCGFATGFLLGFSLGIFDHRNNVKTRMASCIPALVFFTLLSYLLSNYAQNWPPEPYKQAILHNKGTSASGCCADAFEYMNQENTYTIENVASFAYCDGRVLKYNSNNEPVV